jgi:hypothetical protein
MKDFTSEEIQAQFEKLPKELQDAISSPDIQKKIQAIGKKHELMIDQIGELVDQVGLVMLGLAKGPGFVVDISRRLSINPADAQKIAADINNDVLSPMKTGMREVEERSAKRENSNNVASTINSIESAGGFNVIKEKNELGSGDNGANVPTAADRSKILAGVEDPVTSQKIRARKTGDENFTDPLVDHFLKSLNDQPEEKVTLSSQPITPKLAPAIPSNLPTAEEPAVLPPTTSESSTSMRPIPAAPSSPALKPVSPSPVAPKPASSTNKTPDSYREPVN